MLALVAVASIVSSALPFSERQRTSQASAESKAIQRFLVEDLLAGAGRETHLGREVTVAELLESADRKIENAFPDQPAVEAAVRVAIAKAYLSLGRYEQSEVQAAEALELYKALKAELTPAAMEAVSVLEKSLTAQLKYDESLKLCEEALAKTEHTFGPQHFETIRSYRRLAEACVKTDPKRARTLAEQTLSLIAATDGIERREELLATRCLCAALINSGDVDPALRMTERLLVETDEALGPEDRLTLVVKAALIALHYNQANVTKDTETRRSSFRHVARCAEELYETQRRVLGELHPNTNSTAVMLTRAKMKAGDLDGSYTMTMQQHELMCREFGPMSSMAIRHLGTIKWLAYDYAEAGNGDRSVELATLASELCKPLGCEIVAILAAGHAQAGDMRAAEEAAAKAIEMANDQWQRERLLAEGPMAFEIIAAAYARESDFASAIRWTEKLVELWPQHITGARNLEAYRKAKLTLDSGT